MRTFDELFAEHKLTPEERTALVWHLAALRARRTMEASLPVLKFQGGVVVKDGGRLVFKRNRQSGG